MLDEWNILCIIYLCVPEREKENYTLNYSGAKLCIKNT